MRFSGFQNKRLALHINCVVLVMEMKKMECEGAVESESTKNWVNLLLLLLLQALQLQSLNVLAFSTIFFPFMPVLNAVLPIIYVHDIQIIFNIILPSSLGSS
jgi:hypothetical protein